MDISAKITHSVCLYLESLGYMAGDYLELAGITPEKSFDPDSWVDSEKVENFLSVVQNEVPNINIKSIALMEPDLRGWGVLDQVLNIIKSSSEIYISPQNYLSYFVKPLNNFLWVEKTNENTVFKTSLSSEEYPLVTDYLSGALEVVTQFVETEKESSIVFWNENLVSIEWGDPEDIETKSSHPLVSNQNDSVVDKIGHDQLTNSIKLLEDYFLRSRQLVSLLKAESGKKRWFKKALQRLDWDNLEAHFENTVQEIYKQIDKKPNEDFGSEKTKKIRESGDAESESFTLELQ